MRNYARFLALETNYVNGMIHATNHSSESVKMFDQSMMLRISKRVICRDHPEESSKRAAISSTSTVSNTTSVVPFHAISIVLLQ